MEKKKLTFALYINSDSSFLENCLNQLYKIDNNHADIFLYIDDNNDEINTILDSFLNNKKLKNFVFIKNLSYLGVSACYNDAIRNCNSEYIMFMNFNTILDDSFEEDILTYLDKGADIISIQPKNPNIFFNLKKNEYDKLSVELLLGCLHWSIFNKIFNVEFLINNSLSFEHNKWYPEYFLIQTLLTFNKWINVNNELITFWKKQLLNFNLYDFLFEIDLIQKLAKECSIYEEYVYELEFWYVYILKYRFMSKIIDKYKINKEDKLIASKHEEIIRVAQHNINKKIKEFCPSLNKNKYYKLFKNILETNEN